MIKVNLDCKIKIGLFLSYLYENMACKDNW